MSRQLVSHSPDLRRLQDEGYDIEVSDSNYLLVRVPYVTAARQVSYGALVSELTLQGDVTAPPATHVVSFIGQVEGDIPCDDQGHELAELINQRGPIQLGGGLIASCTFSHKPNPTYADYYEKMTTYADMLFSYAQAIDPGVRVRTFPPIPDEGEESVFQYLDTATSRARIGAVTDKIRLGKVVIIGLGGTGAYILDAVVKTPVKQIHLYDGDVMLTHNAFRAPGAATLTELRAAPKKVDYYQAKYAAMHRHIVQHPAHVSAANIDELRDADFVFISIDGGRAKQFIIEKLQGFGISFVDVGMGLYQVGNSLGGLIRTTASSPGHDSHVWINGRISFADEADDEYDQNIQIAELNMFNAAEAVIKWKKIYGFYTDFEHEYSSTYTIDGNHLLNEDQVDENFSS